jgi:hypothetical protein
MDQPGDFFLAELVNIPAPGIAPGLKLIYTTHEVLVAGELTIGGTVAVVFEDLADLVVGFVFSHRANSLLIPGPNPAAADTIPTGSEASITDIDDVKCN